MENHLCIPYIANRSRWKSFAVVEINCNSLENIHGCMVILYGQLLHRLFHWKSFAVTNRSAKTTKFSTSNDLQYTVLLFKCLFDHAMHKTPIMFTVLSRKVTSIPLRNIRSGTGRSFIHCERRC